MHVMWVRRRGKRVPRKPKHQPSMSPYHTIHHSIPHHMLILASSMPHHIIPYHTILIVRFEAFSNCRFRAVAPATTGNEQRRPAVRSTSAHIDCVVAPNLVAFLPLVFVVRILHGVLATKTALTAPRAPAQAGPKARSAAPTPSAPAPHIRRNGAIGFAI